MTRTHLHKTTIDRNGHVMQRTDKDYSFWFSDDISEWIGSKRRESNKRIVEWTRKYRASKKKKS